MTTCAGCGQPASPEAVYCPNCGQQRSDGPQRHSARPAADTAFTRAIGPIPLAMRAKAVPPLLWLIIGVLGLVGVLVLVLFGWILVGAVSALSAGGDFGGAFGMLFLLLVLMLGFEAVMFLGIAASLFLGSRVGRGLAYVFAGDFFLVALLSARGGAAIVLIALAAAGVAAVLAVVPTVRGYFTGPFSRSTETATSIVAAQVLIVLWGAASVLVALVAFLASAGPLTSGVWVLGGILMLGVAVLAFVSRGWVTAGNKSARLAISIATVANLVATIVLGGSGVVPLGLHLGIVALLWLPADARRHFGEKPLDFAAMGLATQDPAPQSAGGSTAYPAPAPAVPATPPAGWYADPAGNGQRYWDGDSWTHHII